MYYIGGLQRVSTIALLSPWPTTYLEPVKIILRHKISWKSLWFIEATDSINDCVAVLNAYFDTRHLPSQNHWAFTLFILRMVKNQLNVLIFWYYELWTMNYELWTMNYELWTMNYLPHNSSYITGETIVYHWTNFIGGRFIAEPFTAHWIIWCLGCWNIFGYRTSNLTRNIYHHR